MEDGKRFWKGFGGPRSDFPAPSNPGNNTIAMDNLRKMLGLGETFDFSFDKYKLNEFVNNFDGGLQNGKATNKSTDLLFNLEEDKTHFYLCFVSAGVSLVDVQFLVEPLKSSWTIRLKRNNAKVGAKLIGNGEVTIDEVFERTEILPSSVNATIIPTLESQNGWLIVTLTKYSESQIIVTGIPVVQL